MDVDYSLIPKETIDYIIEEYENEDFSFFNKSREKLAAALLPQKNIDHAMQAKKIELLKQGYEADEIAIKELQASGDIEQANELKKDYINKINSYMKIPNSKI
jgi:hypothetical protein